MGDAHDAAARPDRSATPPAARGTAAGEKAVAQCIIDIVCMRGR
jgi:hypothetical protein